MKRAPAPKEHFVRGNASYAPFTPGGLDQDALQSEVVPDLKVGQEYVFPSRPGKLVHQGLIKIEDMLAIPPGFERGLIFDGILHKGWINLQMRVPKLLKQVLNLKSC